MIELKIEPYCEECAYFDPVVNSSLRSLSLSLGSDHIKTEVLCKSSHKCRALYKRIEGKENGI